MRTFDDTGLVPRTPPTPTAAPAGPVASAAASVDDNTVDDDVDVDEGACGGAVARAVLEAVGAYNELFTRCCCCCCCCCCCKSGRREVVLAVAVAALPGATALDGLGLADPITDFALVLGPVFAIAVIIEVVEAVVDEDKLSRLLVALVEVIERMSVGWGDCWKAPVSSSHEATDCGAVATVTEDVAEEDDDDDEDFDLYRRKEPRSIPISMCAYDGMPLPLSSP